MGWEPCPLVVLDAILSPGGNGNIFMNTTSRLVYAWARSTLFKIFAKVNKPTGIRVPRCGCRLRSPFFGRFRFRLGTRLSMFALLPWILSYAIAPVFSSGAECECQAA